MGRLAITGGLVTGPTQSLPQPWVAPDQTSLNAALMIAARPGIVLPPIHTPRSEWKGDQPESTLAPKTPTAVRMITERGGLSGGANRLRTPTTSESLP